MAVRGAYFVKFYICQGKVREFQKPLAPVFKAEGGISMRARIRKRGEEEWRPSLPFACSPRALEFKSLHFPQG